jgi:tetratricopeptide (TPR) repeat protein
MLRLAFLLLLCGCSSLTSDEQARLASHQRNAAMFFEGGRLDQAMGQIDRGLQLEPTDYKLRALRGAVLLRASSDATGTDHRRLDEATQVLAEVYDTRAPNRHEPYLLLYYARALQKQGLRHLGEAIRLEGVASRAANRDAAERDQKTAAEARQKSVELLERADALLVVLVERGEQLRVAHNHRLQIARQLGRDVRFLESTNAYLDQSLKDQANTQKEVERTTTPAYEQEQLKALRELRSEELEVRALLAEFHYGRQEHQEALTQLNRVLELDPSRSVDYYNRGRVLLGLERHEEAKNDFRRFLATTTLPATSEKTTFAVQALAK